MNILQKTIAAATITLVSGAALAAIYNHGNHNDPYTEFAIGTVDTINCGSLSLQSCISNTNLSNIATQWCRNKVTDDTDGRLPWGRAYYILVQSFGHQILSTTYNSPGYTADLQYSCTGYLHPAAVGKYQLEPE